MRKYDILFLWFSFILLVSSAYASKSPELQWVARYKGPGNNYGYPTALVVDNSGNVYVTGCSQAKGVGFMADGGKDYLTVKYDKNGKQLWTARYDGPGNSGQYSNGEDSACAIAIDNSGNIYVTGDSKSNLKVNPYFRRLGYATIKYDPNGRELWVKRYDGKGPATDMLLDDSGNIFVTGAGGTIKYKPSGEQVWIGKKSGRILAATLAIDKSGNIYVANGSQIIKYDTNGEQVWIVKQRLREGLAVDCMGNIVVIGYGYPPNIKYEDLNDYSNYDFLTTMYNESGKQLWTARYNGTGNSRDFIVSLGIDCLGNVYVSGNSKGREKQNYCATIKYDNNGNQLWVARYGDLTNARYVVSDMVVDNSGNVYIVGHSGGWSLDVVIVKYDTDGKQLWEVKYTSQVGDVRALTVNDSENVYIIGSGSYGGGEYVTLKYAQHD